MTTPGPNSLPKSSQMFEDDPFGAIKPDNKNETASATEVKAFHRKADTDSSKQAAHHTLGSGRNQASPGSHTHDGSDSKLIGSEMGLAVSGATVGAALTSLITQLQRVMDIDNNTTY